MGKSYRLYLICTFIIRCNRRKFSENERNVHETFIHMLWCFYFVVDGAPLDPNVTSPFNGICLVYVAAMSVFNTVYKKSSDNVSVPTHVSSPTPAKVDH
jgi:hypothetical protein